MKVDHAVGDESFKIQGKPDPSLFLEAAKRLGVRPERIAIVENFLAGVETSHRGEQEWERQEVD